MKIALSVFVFFLHSLVFSQVDSTSLTIDSVKIHSPKKAMIYSAVLPGAGQVYNHLAMPKGKKKAYWKVPLIYAGLGTTGYFLISNNQTQKELKAEYNNRIDNNIYSEKWMEYDNQGILTLYNQYLNWRDLSILGVTLVYLIQVADAGVEAHFVKFDISEDLSVAMDPVYYGNQTFGMKVNFNLR